MGNLDPNDFRRRELSCRRINVAQGNMDLEEGVLNSTPNKEGRKWRFARSCFELKSGGSGKALECRVFGYTFGYRRSVRPISAKTDAKLQLGGVYPVR